MWLLWVLWEFRSPWMQNWREKTKQWEILTRFLNFRNKKTISKKKPVMSQLVGLRWIHSWNLVVCPTTVCTTCNRLKSHFYYFPIIPFPQNSWYWVCSDSTAGHFKSKRRNFWFFRSGGSPFEKLKTHITPLVLFVLFMISVDSVQIDKHRKDTMSIYFLVQNLPRFMRNQEKNVLTMVKFGKESVQAM